MSEADTELTRYGVAWNGPTNPICQEMNDGLWTPWRVAHAEIARLRAERDALGWARVELANIVHAERFNKSHFADDTEFADWAQSRARHQLAAIDAAMESQP